MHRRADRYTLELQVELTIDGKRQTVAVQDISRTGMFLQVGRALAVGTRVHVALVDAASDGKRVITGATVTHVLTPAEALRLGRCPGVGIAFRPPADPADQLFALAIERLCRAQRPARPQAPVHIVIADGDTRLLQRQSNALAEAGFTVATATTGMEAIAACLRRRPDVVAIDRHLPVYDGFRVLETLAQDARFASVPVLVASDDIADVAAAFERGAADFLAKPYTTLELVARARRHAIAGPRATDRLILAGSLAELPLGPLLTMLELERKTGRLAIANAGWIDIVDGRIAGAGTSIAGAGGSTHAADARAIVLELLDRTAGVFELTALAGPHDGELALPITHVLLEHACLRDERGRDVPPPRRRLATAPELIAIAS